MILIDGHNLIGKMPDLRLDDPDDEEKLLIRLRAYRARTGKRLVVYFDPGIAYQSPAHRSNGGISAKQAGSGQQADDLMMQDIRRHRNPSELIVVTSDHTLQDVARLHGARIVDSATFAAELNRLSTIKGKPTVYRRPPSPASDRDKAKEDDRPLSEEEVQAWLAIFGRSNE